MKKLLALCLSIAFTSAAMSAPIKVDAKASKVGFNIFKFKIGKPVDGTFEKFSGSFEVDAKTKLLKSAKGEIVAESIETDSGRRNKHLRSEDFFDVKKFPTISFDLKTHSGKVADGKLTGMLTMKGVSKEVTLNAVVKNPDPNAYEVSLTGVINRKDFNITWNEALDKGGFVLADEVNLVIDIKGEKPVAI